jgi:hypothetical protein
MGAEIGDQGRDEYQEWQNEETEKIPMHFVPAKICLITRIFPGFVRLWNIQNVILGYPVGIFATCASE